MNTTKYCTLIEYWERLSGFKAHRLGAELLTTEQRLLFYKTFEDWPDIEVGRAIESFWGPYSKLVAERSSHNDDDLLHEILFKLFIEEIQHSSTRGKLNCVEYKLNQQ